MSYLDLVEEYPSEPEYTQFEKILVAARRAKDLHNDDKAPLVISHVTAGYVALRELKEGAIKAIYREEEALPPSILEDDSEDGEE